MCWAAPTGLDAGIGCGEAPLDARGVGVPRVDPGGHLARAVAESPSEGGMRNRVAEVKQRSGVALGHSA